MAISLLVACHGNRAATGTSGSEETTEQMGTRHTGTITTDFAKEGCPVLLMLDGKAEEPMLLPIGLDDRYKDHGMRLSFTWRPSRAPSGSCLKGMPAILEDIRVL